MALNQQDIRFVLNSQMVNGKWYEIKDLIKLFSEVYADFEPVDVESIPSEPNRPRWHRLVTNCVRMSPGRNDYPSDNSWIELRTRKPGRTFEYSIAPIDPVELEILRSFVHELGHDDDSGHVYAIVNNAFPGWVKIGKTIDFKQRLSAYQTYSPYQDFKELEKTHVNNRHSAEGFAHRLAADLTRVEQTGEWFFITDEEVSTVLEQVKSKF
jgi:hypothetical protein